MNMQKLILSSLFLILSFSVFGQSSDENYVKTTEYLTEDGESDQKKITVMYYDGLGREKQLKQIGASPNETGAPGDLVTHFDYDGFGRLVKDYLPVPVASTTQTITQNIVSEQYDVFYGSAPYMTQYYYSEKTIENSPLNRVMKQAAPGNDWAKNAGHEIEFEYTTNKANEVRIYWMDSGHNIKRGNYPGVGDYYPASSLYKTVTKDENGNLIREYKNKQGKVVLKSMEVEEGSTFGTNTNLAEEKKPTAYTYYIYDIYGNLVGVVPPLASKKTTMNNGVQSHLCYTYKYDERNRVVEKKIPGKEPEFMVYDKQDRLVATQDAVLRADRKWFFTKYDKFGRVVYTGLFDGGREREDIQEQADQAANNNNETRNSTGFPQNGITVHYTKTAFPTTFTDVLTVNYYDNYSNLNFTQIEDFEMQAVKEGIETNNNLKGMATASFIRILGTDTWEKNFTVYDLKSRPVGVYKTNHLGGFTKTESLLDFRGKPLETETIHYRTSNGTEIKLQDFFTYDGMERPTSHYQSIDNSVRNLIADTEYNRLGQLETKYVGGELGKLIDRWQEIDYKYNIRGWLTDINSVGVVLLGRDQVPPGLGDDLFAFKIQYNQLANGGSNVTDPLYNGNIAQTFWKTAEDNVLRGYHYTYDKMNRLRKADFYKEGNANITAYGEYLAYDLNGNIQRLIRSTGDATDNEIAMDDLTYAYHGGTGNSNLLMNVTEGVTTGGGTGGFKDGNTNPSVNDYQYDTNGNMIQDLNKAITSITYNHLNLPTQIYWAADKKIDYLYNAAGQKLKKTVRDGNTQKVVDYLDGFQYAGGILQFFPHAEGYVKATPVNRNNTVYAFNYVFNYTDHLGNVRLSFTKDPLTQQLKIMEENHYYPFGLKHSVFGPTGIKDFKENLDGGSETILTNVLTTSYQYKYNGKEFQDELGLGLYDYGARNYDSAIGRFFNLDRYSDAYYHITPYQYTANNPVRLIDVNGEYIWIYENGNKYKYENGQLYSQNKETKEYDQAYTAEEGSYVAQMKGFLNKIGCDDCSAGKELLGFFENDERNITIKENKEKRPQYKEKNAFNGAGNTVLTFFNEKNHIPTVDGFESISENFFATLGHELGHAKSHFSYGGVTDEPWYIQYDSDGKPQKVKKDEVYAIFIENKIRSENKLPLRTHYSAESEFKVNENSRVLHKVKGNWIMTPAARVILNAIQSPSNRK